MGAGRRAARVRRGRLRIGWEAYADLEFESWQGLTNRNSRHREAAGKQAGGEHRKNVEIRGGAHVGMAKAGQDGNFVDEVGFCYFFLSRRSSAYPDGKHPLQFQK